MSQLRPASKSFCGFSPSTERIINQRYGHVRTRKYSVVSWMGETNRRHAAEETTPVLRRTLSLPDCHELAKLDRTTRKHTKAVSTSNHGGNGLKRTRSVSFPPEVLMFAAVADNDVVELQRILEEHEVDINHQSPSGLTALHYAAAEGSLECLQELVSRGVLLDVQDSQGCSPLDFAARGGYFDCAAYLIRAGAQIGNIINGVR